MLRHPLEERLDVALQAKTYGELETLVADLSAGAPLPDALVSAAAVGAANADEPGGALFDDETLARLRQRTRAVELLGRSR